MDLDREDPEGEGSWSGGGGRNGTDPLGFRVWSQIRLGVDYLYRKGGSLDLLIEIRWTRINVLGSPNKKTEIFYKY